MELKVIKPFNGKAEGKTLCKGDVITTTDVARINALVGRGFCEICSLSDNPATAGTPSEADTEEAVSATPRKGSAKKK